MSEYKNMGERDKARHFGNGEKSQEDKTHEKQENSKSVKKEKIKNPHYISNNQLLEMIIALFTKKPQYRDDRWGTIMYIDDRICENVDNRRYILKTAFDTDRYFRWLQEKYPELRGKTWVSRQKQSGNKNTFDLTPQEKKQAEEMMKQLQLFK